MAREKAVCGNPLFLSWVEELRDQAKERGTKAAESYGKAARSLAACPVPYARPRELVVLAGIGPKIVNVLEGKWKVYCAENGLPPPGTPQKTKSKGKARASTPDTDQGTHSEASPPPTRIRKAANPKPHKRYIPARGSGGYGILLGLLCCIDEPELNTQVFLTKGEVIRASQPYSDNSYDHSEKGTYFTAWSSMKALIGKGYVYVTGNPHKYCLTEEGYEVACAIRALRPEMAGVEKHPFIHEPVDPISRAGPSRLTTQSSRITPYLPSPPATSSESGLPPKRTSGGRAEMFQFWYIDSSGNRTTPLTAAAIRLDPEEFTSIRKVEFLASQLSLPFASQLRLVGSEPGRTNEYGQNTLFGYIFEEGAPPFCSKFHSSEGHVAPKRKKSDSLIIDDDWVGLPGLPGLPPPVAPKAKDPTSFPLNAAASTFARTASVPAASSMSTTSNLAAEAALRRLGKDSAFERTQSASAAGPSKPRPAPRLSSHIPVSNPLLDPNDEYPPAVKIPDFNPSHALVFPTGTYEVILILDTREVESKTNRERIGEKLLDKGVHVETRALKLGDVCWIARRTDGIGGEEDECVLDYVVERKRLDDLCSSIKDGRYNEQCFRLSNSCINNVFYVVEDWQTTHLYEVSGAQIMTAKSQLQVHNRFFLKETTRLSETIDFLVMMTGIIRSLLASTDLHVIPTRYLSRPTYAALQTHLKATRPDITYLTSFQAYQDLNDKSASATLREKFARMLFCVRGMSAERVSAVLDTLDSPRGLWEELKVAREEERAWKRRCGESGVGDKGKGKNKRRGADMFFADRIQGEGRRKIGDALSRDLYRAFMGTDDDDS